MIVKTHLIVKDFLSPAQCEEIKQIGNSLPNKKEEFGGDEGRYSYYSEITPCRIPNYEESIHKKFERLNKKHFGFDLNFETWYNGSYLTYEEGNFTNWHIDGGVGEEYASRKLSCVIVMSDQGIDFEGGDFELPFYLNLSDAERKSIKKGTAIMFPSFMFHRVTTVTKGLRNSLTFFIEGKSFV